MTILEIGTELEAMTAEWIAPMAATAEELADAEAFIARRTRSALLNAPRTDYVITHACGHTEHRIIGGAKDETYSRAVELSTQACPACQS